MTRCRAACFAIAIGLTVACSHPAGPERELSGEQLYSQYCARCHGADGSGSPDQPQARDLSNKQLVDLMSDERIKGVIRGGKPPLMPAFGDQFTDAALMVLVAQVRKLAGSQGPKAREQKPAAGKP